MQVVTISPIVLLNGSHIETDLEEGNTSSIDTTTPDGYYLPSVLDINPITNDSSTGW